MTTKKVATKKSKPAFPKTVLGYGVNKLKNGYSFGCGAVRVSFDDVKAILKEREERKVKLKEAKKLYSQVDKLRDTIRKIRDKADRLENSPLGKVSNRVEERMQRQSWALSLDSVPDDILKALIANS